jgi:hypothetical protein
MMGARYVIPAKAGISGRKSAASRFPETPAFAGVTR